MQLAIGQLEKIEMCDNFIEEGNKPDYFKSVKQEALENYAQAMTDLMEMIIKETNIEIAA